MQRRRPYSLSDLAHAAATLILHGSIWVNAATFVRGTVPSEDVIFGCESAELKSGSAHFVIATYDGDATQWLPWVWQVY